MQFGKVLLDDLEIGRRHHALTPNGTFVVGVRNGIMHAGRDPLGFARGDEIRDQVALNGLWARS